MEGNLSVPYFSILKEYIKIKTYDFSWISSDNHINFHFCKFLNLKKCSNHLYLSLSFAHGYNGFRNGHSSHSFFLFLISLYFLSYSLYMLLFALFCSSLNLGCGLFCTWCNCNWCIRVIFLPFQDLMNIFSSLFRPSFLWRFMIWLISFSLLCFLLLMILKNIKMVQWIGHFSYTILKMEMAWRYIWFLWLSLLLNLSKDTDLLQDWCWSYLERDF